MKPEDFVNLRYKPTEDDLICLFRVEPEKGTTIKTAAANVALESSTGTWAEVSTEKEYMKKLSAKVFSINGKMIKIAYPSELFEKGNAPNILSSIAGNIFGMKMVKGLRLEDVKIPKSIINSFKGPKYGIDGIRKMMKVKERPFIGTIIKPKLGLKTIDHAKVAYEAWAGGCDFVKDDENLSSQDFNKFEQRLVKTLEMADKAKSETGEEKVYFVNVTAETGEMLRRAELVKSHGGKAVMIDVITEGFGAVQTLRKVDLGLAIHGHRAMHAAFTRNKKHGVSMMVLADLCRLIGIDSLHIGTAIGKLEGSIKEVSEIEEEIEQKHVIALRDRLSQNWRNIKPTLAVSSGGLHPGHVPFLVKNLGKDLIIQMGGGIHGHPQGTRAGAVAARQAIDASMKNIPLKEYAKTHEELRQAIEKFK